MEVELQVKPEDLKKALDKKFKEYMVEQIKIFPEEVAKEFIDLSNVLIVCEKLLAEIKENTTNKKIIKLIDEYFEVRSIK